MEVPSAGLRLHNGMHHGMAPEKTAARTTPRPEIEEVVQHENSTKSGAGARLKPTETALWKCPFCPMGVARSDWNMKPEEKPSNAIRCKLRYATRVHHEKAHPKEKWRKLKGQIIGVAKHDTNLQKAWVATRKRTALLLFVGLGKS